MPQSDNVGATVEFGANELKANAAVYHGAKRIVDAASGFESLDDAIAALTGAWEVLESQIEHGSGYTPDTKLGFGSDNAAVIAESLLGRRNSVGSTRREFNKLGE